MTWLDCRAEVFMRLVSPRTPIETSQAQLILMDNNPVYFARGLITEPSVNNC